MGVEEARPALGDEAAERFGTVYYLLLMLGSHDFAVLRGAFGDPVEVLDVRLIDDRCIFATVGFEHLGPCVLELAISTNYSWCDQAMTVYGNDEILTMHFADPFVPFTRSALTTRAARDGGHEDVIVTGGPEDAFRREWRHFAECIREGKQPLTPLSQGLADVELAVELIRQLD